MAGAREEGLLAPSTLQLYHWLGRCMENQRWLLLGHDANVIFHILSNLNAEKCAADPSKLYMLEYNMLERQFLIGMVRPDHRPGCVIVSEYIALLCAIGFQIFSLEPAYQFLLPVFCPYCEAVLLEAVFLIKMMFDVNEARWKVSTFSSIC